MSSTLRTEPWNLSFIISETVYPVLTARLHSHSGRCTGLRRPASAMVEATVSPSHGCSTIEGSSPLKEPTLTTNSASAYELDTGDLRVPAPATEANGEEAILAKTSVVRRPRPCTLVARRMHSSTGSEVSPCETSWNVSCKSKRASSPKAFEKEYALKGAVYSLASRTDFAP